MLFQSCVYSLAITLLLCLSSPLSANILSGFRQEPGGFRLQGEQPIGALLPLTGALGSLGRDIAAGIRKGVEDYNDKLRQVNAGWSLTLNLRDTSTYPVEALSQLQILKAQNISLVLGSVMSASLNKTRPLAVNNETLLFSPSSVSTALSIPDDGVFRLVPDADILSAFFVRQLVNDGIDTIMFISWDGDDLWRDSLKYAITIEFAQNNGATWSSRRYSPADFDPSLDSGQRFRNACKLVRKLDSDLMFMAEQKGNLSGAAVVVLSFGEITDILASAEALASDNRAVLDDLRWYGVTGTYPEIITNPRARKFAGKVQYSTMIPGIDTSLPAYHDVRAAIQQMQGISREPDVHSYIAYDAVQILARAIFSADSTDPLQVIMHLPWVARYYNGFMGNTTLNKNGDLMSGHYQRWQVIDGQWQRVSSDKTRGGFLAWFTDF